MAVEFSSPEAEIQANKSRLAISLDMLYRHTQPIDPNEGLIGRATPWHNNQMADSLIGLELEEQIRYASILQVRPDGRRVHREILQARWRDKKEKSIVRLPRTVLAVTEETSVYIRDSSVVNTTKNGYPAVTEYFFDLDRLLTEFEARQLDLAYADIDMLTTRLEQG